MSVRRFVPTAVAGKLALVGHLRPVEGSGLITVALTFWVTGRWGGPGRQLAPVHPRLSENGDRTKSGTDPKVSLPAPDRNRGGFDHPAETLNEPQGPIARGCRSDDAELALSQASYGIGRAPGSLEELSDLL